MATEMGAESGGTVTTAPAMTPGDTTSDTTSDTTNDTTSDTTSDTTNVITARRRLRWMAPACVFGALVSVLVSALVGCGPHGGGAGADRTPGRAGRPAATTAVPSAADSVITPPGLDPGEVLAARTGVRSGSAELPYRAGRKGLALIVAVSCRGGGRIEVRVQPVRTSFLLLCGRAADTSRNELRLTGVEKPGTVVVTAPSGVTWALTVGRGVPAPEEDQDRGTALGSGGGVGARGSGAEQGL